jgi:fibro-slime domain-containing protein
MAAVAAARGWLAAGLALSALSMGAGQEQLVYRLTIRDMLPAICMNNSAYMDAWGGLGDNPLNTLTATDYTGDTLSGNLTVSGSQFKSRICPYFKWMRTGVISGHPDFEASTKQYVDGIVNSGSCAAPTTCWKVNTQPIVDLGGLVTDAAGLRKLQSCAAPDKDGRCGAQLGATSPAKYGAAKKEFFSSWYSDSAKYSKRIGARLALTRDPQGLYVFDSATSSGGNPKFNPLGAYVSAVTEQLYPNPEDAPAWPVAPLVSATGKFWYTVELHTFFQYNGGEKFEFSGDDDVWVWINGKLAVDLGGLHSERAQSISLDALQSSLGLAKGGIYTFDMFHAERHTSASNFKITTTLTSNCNVLRSGSTVVDSASASASAASWLALGAAQVTGPNQLQLVPRGSTAGDASAVYLRKKINAGAGFVVQFSFAVTNGAGELPPGFALLLHNRDEGLINLPVTTGANLNYRNIPNSTAIVFELCQDPDAGCKQQEVSLQRAAVAGDPISAGASPRKTRRAPVLRTLRFPGEVHNVSIEYLETPDWLEVYIDDSLYLREEGFSVRGALLGRDAFIGFTSSVAHANAAQITISDVKISAVSISPANTTVEPAGAQTQAAAPADGLRAAKVPFRTRDLCGNPVDNGGFASQAAALFVEELPLAVNGSGSGGATGRRLESGFATTYASNASAPAIVYGVVTDLGTGIYTADLATRTPGAFSAHICFGGVTGCNFTTQLVPDAANAGLFKVVVTPVGAEFHQLVQRAVIMTALTPPPTLAPTPALVVPPGDDGKTVRVAGIAGGLAAAGLVAALVVLFLLRKKWQKDKAFIEGGMAYRADQSVDTYSKSDQYTMVGKTLLDTRAAVLKQRAQAVKDDRGADIATLTATNEELVEQVRIAKMQKQINEHNASQSSAVRNVARKEFGANRSDSV